MTADLPELARQARDVLSEATEVTLLISGLGRLGPDDPAVFLEETDGSPSFVCLPESPVACSVGRTALLTATGTGLTVILGGLLTLVTSADGVVTVSLPVTQVVVETQDGTSPTVTQWVIPVELYRQAEPDPLARYAQTIIEHTNDAHSHELREFIARRHRRPGGDIGEASLAALNRCGAQIDWIDLDGTHTDTIRFSHPAHDEAMLGALLREQLTGQRLH